jgi:hypothetical protein
MLTRVWSFVSQSVLSRWTPGSSTPRRNFRRAKAFRSQRGNAHHREYACYPPECGSNDLHQRRPRTCFTIRHNEGRASRVPRTSTIGSSTLSPDTQCIIPKSRLHVKRFVSVSLLCKLALLTGNRLLRLVQIKQKSAHLPTAPRKPTSRSYMALP